jgi:hypothetical protein
LRAGGRLKAAGEVMRICRTSSWQRSKQPQVAMTSVAKNDAEK